MTLSEARVRHTQLVEEIRRHDHAYYVLAQPTVLDAEYDLLFQQLVDLEKEFPKLTTPDSPTQRVGGEPVGSFARVEHLVPMLSLEKIEPAKEPNEKDEPDSERRHRLQDENTIKRLKDFDRTIRKHLNKSQIDYVLEPKVDGVSISVHYRFGELKRGVTRGDGRFGDDITSNIRAIKAIPLKLNIRNPPRLLEVRGEAYISKNKFNELNAKLEAEGRDAFPNARNATAGTLKQLDPKIVARRPISAVFYAVGACEGINFSAHSEVLESLKRLGLPTQSFWRVCKGMDAVLACYESEVVSSYHESKDLRTRVPYEIDGIVLKVNDMADWKKIPSKPRAPGYAIVHKPIPWITPVETILRTITVQVGRTGVLTPVAELDPVFVQGSTISRATLHNEDEIKRKDIRIGDSVVIRKAGMVIPEVQSVLKTKRPPAAQPFDLFEYVGGKCPACLGPIAKEKVSAGNKEEVAWRCLNVAGCPAQKVGRIEHFAQRKALELESLGGIVAEKLVQRHLVDEPLDLFELAQDKLAQLNLGTEDEPRLFGQKNAVKLMTAVERARLLPLSRWLFALGILNVGEVTAYEIARLHKDLADVAHSPILKEIVRMEHDRQAIRNAKVAEKTQLPKAKTAQQKRDKEAYSSSLLALKRELDERAKGSPKLRTQLEVERTKLESQRLHVQQQKEALEASIAQSEQADAKKELRSKLSKLKSTLKRIEPQILKVGIHEAIGPVVADSVVRFFDSNVGKRLLERLESLGIGPRGGLGEEILDSDAGPFSEKTFVLTGTLTSMTREEAAEEIRKRGGKVTNSVSKTTTYLVIGENAGVTKSEQARKLGVEEVSEQQFMTMLGRKPDNRIGNQQQLL